jgi:RNA polymerase sigma-70 factor, ECF subfamily
MRFIRRQPNLDAHRVTKPVGQSAVCGRDDFGAIYERFFPVVFGYCLSQLGDPEAAEDAAGQTFLKALAALPGYREIGRVRPWLFAIAHNVIRDANRSRMSDAPLELAIEIRDPAVSPEEQAIEALDVAWLDEAIGRLTSDDRQVVELRRAGLRGREIAAVLGITYEAAKKRQLRAMDRLRADLNAAAENQGVRRDA